MQRGPRAIIWAFVKTLPCPTVIQEGADFKAPITQTVPPTIIVRASHTAFAYQLRFRVRCFIYMNFKPKLLLPYLNGFHYANLAIINITVLLPERIQANKYHNLSFSPN